MSKRRGAAFAASDPVAGSIPSLCTRVPKGFATASGPETVKLCPLRLRAGLRFVFAPSHPAQPAHLGQWRAKCSTD